MAFARKRATIGGMCGNGLAMGKCGNAGLCADRPRRQSIPSIDGPSVSAAARLETETEVGIVADGNGRASRLSTDRRLACRESNT
jgi:hypothetical protein